MKYDGNEKGIKKVGRGEDARKVPNNNAASGWMKRRVDMGIQLLAQDNTERELRPKEKQMPRYVGAFFIAWF